MKKPLLIIKNLSVKLGQKSILHNLNLTINEGEIHILIGPNGSGKSTLASVIMGLNPFKIIKGDIIFKHRKINSLLPEKRFNLGISLVFQNPPPIKGVTLQTIAQHIQNKCSLKKTQSFGLFSKEIQNLLNRDIYAGFSGGEKKISELYQVALNKNNKLIIFDEIDSGLDLEKTKLVIDFIKQKSTKDKIAFLIITHREELLKLINPSFVEVILGGEILCCSKNWRSIFQTINKYGYERCKTCNKSHKIQNNV